MKKGIIGLMTACMLFNLVVVSHTQKVEAAATYELATSISVGDTVVLVCESKKMELTSIGSYGTGTKYDLIPSGSYPLTVTAGSSSGTYALKTKDNKYLNWSSSNSLSTATSVSSNSSWTITFSSQTATIENGKDSTRKLQWNASSPRFACYTSNQTAVNFYKLVNLDCDHTYGEVETPNQTFKVSDATCTTPAVYFKECILCHNVKIEETYEYGEPLGHNYENGECTRCGVIDDSKTPTERVSSLFNSYYNEGSYTKYSVLNTNKDAIKEVAKYFHASADTKYRKTEYTPDGLKMTISDTEDGEYTNESIYTNEGGKVVHTGLGGNWTVNKPSVEDWFVTLKDFVDNPGTNWNYEDGVYVHALVAATATEEDELTRMAREFVAPMWLAPNKDNFAYARFNKLTVQETNNTLVMKLYVENNDLLEEKSNNVFSQVTISRNHIWGNPVDLQDGTHQQTCTKNECSVTLQPVDHNFGSGTTCECGAIKSSTVSSKLNREFTGIAKNSSGYAEWSGKTDSNGIVFAGQSAGSNDSIQLRSSNSNSGIVVTQNETGKKVAKITIVWQTSTTNGRTLDVYGKNSAYTKATDLYSSNSSTKGTKIGSIVKGTSTELEITGDYAYIGLRSSSGAMYITSITIEWK